MKFIFHSVTVLALVALFNSAYSQDIWLEAECGQLGSDWISVEDNSASENEAIMGKAEYIANPPQNSAGVMTMYFNVSEPGDYKGFGRVMAPSGSNNSFWVSVNDEPWIEWNDIPSSTNGNTANGQLPVVPGGVGYGIDTRAGRKGKVFKVSNLNDRGAGSLRECVEAEGSRVCIFEVSGYIDIATPLVIRNPNLTIAGQTAPSPGVVVGGGAGVMIQTQNVLIQHIGIRPGDGKGISFENRDAVQIIGLEAGKPADNIVIDHCTIAWGIDGTMDIGRYVGDVTISNCIIAETLNDSKHPKGEHSFASALYDWSGKARVAIVNSYFAHNYSRQVLTRVKRLFYANNLHYDREHRFTNISNRKSDNKGGYNTYSSLVGNVYVEGPSLKSDIKPIHIDTRELKQNSRIYLNNNHWSENNSSDPAKLIENYRASLMQGNPTVWLEGDWKSDKEEIINYVLNNVGARPSNRNKLDQRLIDNFKNRRGKLIDCINGCSRSAGGWPELAKNTRKLSIPNNPNGDNDGDGYTNLEEWLHSFLTDVQPEVPFVGFDWFDIKDTKNKRDVSFSLPNGINKISFAVREKETLLDKVYLTKTNKVPSNIDNKGINCSQSAQVIPLAFTLSKNSITLAGNFDGPQFIQLKPEANLGNNLRPEYRISPDVRRVAFVNISIDSKTGEIRLLPKAGQWGSGTFKITAVNPINKDQTYVKELSVTVKRPVEPDLTKVSSFPLRINAGGFEYTNSDNETYLADIFSSGSSGPGTASGSLSNITERELFERYRKGTDYSYNIPVPNGKYRLILRFAEPSFTANGKRVFDVTIEGRKRLDNLDIFRSAGHRKELRRTFNDIEVKDGSLDLRFVSEEDEALISSIEVYIENTPPVFTISQDELLIDQDFNEKVNITSVLEEVPLLEKNQRVTFSLQPAKSDLLDISINAESGKVDISNISNKSGTQQFTIIANDGQPENNTYSRVLRVVINEVPVSIPNTPPIFTLTQELLELEEDFDPFQKIFHTLNNPKPGEENENITYSISPLDSDILNVSIDAKTGEISFNPIKDAAGEQAFTITLNDGKTENNSFSQILNVKVIPINDPPLFVLSESTVNLPQGFPGSKIVEVLRAIPPKNEQREKVFYTITPRSSSLVGISLDAINGTIKLNSIGNKIGTETFIVTATDGQSENHLASASLTVNIYPPDELRINCGGPSVILSDGKRFEADQYFRKESQVNVSKVEIENTVFDKLYQTERSGKNFIYEVPLKNGDYDLFLHFSEIQHKALDKRVFDISVEGGQKQLLNFDISAYVNPRTAKTVFISGVSVEDNFLTIDFISLLGQAQINAIEIVSSGSSEIPENLPPLFSLQKNISLVENFSGIVSINPELDPKVRNEMQEEVIFSIDPPISNLANINIDPHTGKVSLASIQGQTGQEKFMLTADNGQSANNIFRQTFYLNISPVGPILKPEKITPIRINAGGETIISTIGNVFVADSYHGNTGQSHICDVRSLGGNGADLYLTDRIGDKVIYNVPVPNGPYQVILHFSETEFEESNKRVFEGRIEGERLLNNFDIFHQGGFANVITKSFDNILVTDKILTLELSSIIGKAKINGIEISSMLELDLRPSLRINCGAGTKTSFGGHIYEPDTKFFSNNTKAYFKDRVNDVKGTSFDDLYKSGRITHEFLDPFSYEIPVKNGKYMLFLHFAEGHFTDNGQNQGKNQRVFDVVVEDEKEIVNLDLISEVGEQTALVKRIEVNIQDGELDLEFIPSIHKASISAIELLIPSDEHTSLIYQPKYQSGFTGIDNESQLQVGNENKLTFFPNPTKTDAKLLIQGDYRGNLHIKIYDPLGKVVEELDFEKVEFVGKYLIPLRKLTAGIYILETNLGGFVDLQKIVKE